MFYKHLPAYRPGVIYADLLEWHRQVQRGCDREVTEFMPEEFALIIARAELIGALRCPAGPAPTEVHEEIDELIDGFSVRAPEEPEHQPYYCEAFVRLASQYGPGPANTFIEYALARAAWQPEPWGLPLAALERFADRLPETVEHVLALLDFTLAESAGALPACSDCGASIPNGQVVWTVNLHRELASDPIQVLRADELLRLCAACVARRPLAGRTVVLEADRRFTKEEP